MRTQKQSEHLRWLIFISVVGFITFAGYFVVYPQTLYKPGEELFDFGYNLGLIGGLMMVLLLLYPLRKRLPILEKVGFLAFWFKWHMLLGILGPLFIIFHSTYHVYIPFIHPTGSINAAVAMYCMILVSASGTFGRFFYTKIHHGLYGRQATMNEMQAEMAATGEVKSMFEFAPGVERALEAFRDKADRYAHESGYGFVHFFKVGIETSILVRRLPRELHAVMQEKARAENFSAEQKARMEQMFIDYREKIVNYLKAIRDTAQFRTYERLFSWWHIFHIPLVFMMVFSAIYHVYAVHAY